MIISINDANNYSLSVRAKMHCDRIGVSNPSILGFFIRNDLKDLRKFLIYMFVVALFSIQLILQPLNLFNFTILLMS